MRINKGKLFFGAVMMVVNSLININDKQIAVSFLVGGAMLFALCLSIEKET